MKIRSVAVIGRLIRTRIARFGIATVVALILLTSASILAAGAASDKSASQAGEHGGDHQAKPMSVLVYENSPITVIRHEPAPYDADLNAAGTRAMTNTSMAAARYR